MTKALKKGNAFLAVLAALLIGACAATVKTTEAPDWVNGMSARYPAQHYLIGRGAAAGLEEAKDRARADLAKAFEVAISAESADLQTFERVTQGADEPVARGQLKISRNIQTRTERVVQGVEIADLWQDPTSGTHYALAVLRRLQAAQTLRDDIQRLDDATRRSIDLAGAERDLLKRIAAASRAVEAQVERATVQRSLQVVDVTGRGMPAPWPLEQLRNDREALIRRLTLATQASGPQGEALQSMLDGAVSASGFTLAAPAEARFYLIANLELADLDRREGWYWEKGILEVTLSEADHKVRGLHRWNIKSSALSRDDAQRRALDQVNTILKEDLRAVLIGFTAGK